MSEGMSNVQQGMSNVQIVKGMGLVVDNVMKSM